MASLFAFFTLFHLSILFFDLSFLNLTQYFPQRNKTSKGATQLYKYGRGNKLKSSGSQTLCKLDYKT